MILLAAAASSGDTAGAGGESPAIAPPEGSEGGAEAAAAASPEGAGGSVPRPFPGLRADFTATSDDRVFIDIPLQPPSGEAAFAALVLSGIELDHPAAIRAATVHLHSGAGWWAAELSPASLDGTLRLPFSAFVPEGDPGPPSASDILRISLWRAPLPAATELRMEAISFAAPASVAIVRATEATAPKETAFAAQMAARLESLLSRAGIPFDTIPDTALPALVSASAPEGSGAAPRRLSILLPYNPTLPRATISALRKYVEDGGFLVVFYNSSPDLAAMLGFPPPRWKGAAEGRWASIDWEGRRIPHSTVNLLVPEAPPKPPARVVATWAGASGKATALPAVLASPRGALFAHVPPLAFSAAQDLLSSLLAGHGAPENAGDAAASHGTGPLPLDFPVVAAWVPNSRIQGAIPSALGTLYAYAGEDGSAAAVPAGGKTRPAVHVWLPLLCAVDRPGGGWLDPADPATRQTVLGRVREVARRHPAGIHFDYARTGDGVPASHETTAAVTDLLRRACSAVRSIDPGITISAAVFPTPSAAALRNQDWPAWIRDGFLDYAVPMIYDDSPASFGASLAQCLAVAPPDRLVAGIGTGADESQVDAPSLRAELEAASAANLRGVAFFPLDDALRALLH